ncbi:MAG: DUF4214 domain-containing protein [Clostridiales bacterium]|nr:DUF4214 domain-containing protein [Clostridiales bacterium]
MVTRNFGNKIVGAVLSAAMVLTAIPVCTMNSLACETDHYDDGAYISAQPVETTDLETLIDYFTSVVNFFYDKEDILTSDEDEQCRSIFNSVSLVIRDPDADASDYSEASAALDSVVDLINNIIASAPVEDETPVETNEVTALDRLFALCDEVEQFISVFGSEVPEGQLFALQNALMFAEQVAVYADELPESSVVEMTAQLNYYYNAAIDAADAAAQADQTPAEETADDEFVVDPQDPFTITPDFEIDPQDSFTLTGEPEDEIEPETVIENEIAADEIVAETAAETLATPAPAAAPAASAPVGQVLGAERNRAFVVDQIVESLYVNALDRNSDFAGKNSWVNMILTGEADIDTVVRGFLNSAEFEARDLSDDAFIMVLYRVMFNRVPSADELNNWTAALAAGTTRTQVIDAFLNSAESEAVCDKYDL